MQFDIAVCDLFDILSKRPEIPERVHDRSQSAIRKDVYDILYLYICVCVCLNLNEICICILDQLRFIYFSLLEF